MTIFEASAEIAQALASGRIDAQTAERAQRQIRERSYYGNRMTADRRAAIVRLRFGIEAVAA